MTPERWRIVKSVFEGAVAHPKGDRVAFLDRACADDPALRTEVEAMLAADERVDGCIEDPLVPAGDDLLETDDGALVGRQVGQYRIRATLGRGGMGDVYLAEDDSLGRKVALKVLTATGATARARLVREARLASALDHPNICTVYEVAEVDGVPFISMQYVAGETLQHLAGTVGLTMDRVVSIARQVASALAAAHARGVVHRDIKPGNIMLTASGDVKVLDFGISISTARADQREDASRLTRDGAWLGTPAYMSPEQARGEPVDHRTDIFSFGAVLYELATGRAPFGGASSAAVMQAVISSQHVSANAINPAVPAGLSAIIDRALAKSVDERYQSMTEMEADLRHLDLGVVTGASPVVERGGQSARAGHATSRLPALLLAGALTLTLALGVVSWFGVSRTPLTSVAVMPFVHAAAAPVDLEYLADGIAESVTTRLSQLPQLRVMARSTMFMYKGRPLDPRTVGRELGVRAVITGEVVPRDDGSVLIRVELVDADDGSRLWGAEYSRPHSEVFELPGEVALAAFRELRVRASGQEEQRLTRDYTRSAEAYQLYLKGRYFWNKRTADAYGRAIEHFRGAIERDPTFALAYSGLADSYVMLRGYGLRASEDTVPQAIAAAEHALRLDDALAEAHTSLGHARMLVHDWSGADTAFRRAIDLNRNYATAHHWQAMYLAQVGRLDEANQAIRRAQALDPLSLIINTEVGRLLFFTRRYDEAITQYARTLELDPTFALAHLHLGMTLVETGAYPAAIAEFEKASAMGGTLPSIGLVRAYAGAGRRAEALELARRIRMQMEQGFAPPYAMAVLCVTLDDHEGALTWLEKGARDGGAWFLRVHPVWDPLRRHPRFEALLRHVYQSP